MSCVSVPPFWSQPEAAASFVANQASWKKRRPVLGRYDQGPTSVPMPCDQSPNPGAFRDQSPSQGTLVSHNFRVVGSLVRSRTSDIHTMGRFRLGPWSSRLGRWSSGAPKRRKCPTLAIKHLTRLRLWTLVMTQIEESTTSFSSNCDDQSPRAPFPARWCKGTDCG